MSYTFKAQGHRNILGTHMNTLEITKDKDVSERGNCIIGVNADFRLKEIRRYVERYGSLSMMLEAGGKREEIDFKVNKDFESDHEIVVRLGNFASERTLGTDASKSSKMLSREIMEKMKDPKQKMRIVLGPKIKAVILDLDGTLEDFDRGKYKAYRRLGKLFYERYSVYPDTTARLLEEVDHEFVRNAEGKGPEQFDRRRWFPEFFKMLGIKADSKEIQEYVDIYWEEVNSNVRLFTGVKSLLAKLKREHKLVLLSDADGPREIKDARIDQLGIRGYFDMIIVGNDIGENKPHVKFYEAVMQRFNVRADQCMMVGDKPWADLAAAKKIGIHTVWARQGKWGDKKQRQENELYIDHEIGSIKDLTEVLRKI